MCMNIVDLLNQHSEKKFAFPALKNPNCSYEDILQTMRELKEVPFYHNSLDEEYMSVIQQHADQGMNFCLHLLEKRKLPIPQTNTDELNRYFLQAIIALQKKDWQEAIRSLFIYDSYDEVIFSLYKYLYFYRGLAWYGLQEYEKADEDFRRYISANYQDEMAHFYRGNALFFLGKYQEVIDEYIKVLNKHANFQEVINNTLLLERILINPNEQDEIRLNWQDNPFLKTLAIPENIDIWTIPIFINNFNRLGSLKRLVGWLTSAGYKNIYILDNNSSYQQLLEYYKQLEKNSSAVQVLRLGKNIGHTAIWDSGILEKLAVEEPYVYTDSDVVPIDECPEDFLHHLVDILRRYPLLKKVGLGLRIDGITCKNAEEIIAREKRYYMHEIEPELYFGAVDTTFALYRNYRHYHLGVAARTTGNWMAWHLPWHYDYSNLPPDELYYAQHANASASLLAALKKKVNN